MGPQLNHCWVALVPSPPIGLMHACRMVGVVYSTRLQASRGRVHLCYVSAPSVVLRVLGFRYMSTAHPHGNLEKRSWEPERLSSSWTGRQLESSVCPFFPLKNFTVLTKVGIERRKRLQKAQIQASMPDIDQGSQFTPFTSRLQEVPPRQIQQVVLSSHLTCFWASFLFWLLRLS